MNIFSDYGGFLGELDFARFKQTNADFLALANSIRERLGVRAYYLDSYLDTLFNSLCEASAVNVMDRGFEDTFRELKFICDDIIAGEGKRAEHPFYSTAKSYIDGHPLAFQEKRTKFSLYFCALAPDFIGYAVPVFAQEMSEDVRTQAHLDLLAFRDLYNEICAVLGGGEDMENLNSLLQRRYMASTFVSMFVQGFIHAEIATLSFVDPETSKSISRLLHEMYEKDSRKGCV